MKPLDLRAGALAALSLLFADAVGAAGAARAQEARDPAAATPVAPRQAVTGLSPAQEAALHDRSAELGGPDVAGLRTRSAGLVATERGWLGLGPGYKVELEPGGFRFVPALGRRAPENRPLEFRFDSIERGGERLGGLEAQPALTAQGRTASWSVAPGVDMRLEMRPEGAELGFVFDAAPAGSGDLLVRGRVATEMTARRTGDVSDGLRFDAGEHGGVTVGRVTGVDANGTTAAGRLVFDGTHLEMSLPASFVEEAAYPLTLDPLVGAIQTLTINTDDDDPDVAYDATNDLYLVVWERYFSDSDWDVRALRVSSSGTAVGSVLALESSAAVQGFNPTVASCNFGDAFLVAWQEGPSAFGPWDIKAARVEAATGIVSTVIDVATTSANEIDPDAGGEASLDDNDVLVVWEEEGAGIRGAEIVTSVSVTPFIVGTFTLSTSADDEQPAISKSGGASGTFLVVWQRLFADSATDYDLWYSIVDRDGAALQGATALLTTIGPNEERADVDGDGSRWIVAYDTETVQGTADHDIACRAVRWDGASATVDPETIVEGDLDDDERQPSVAYVGGGKHFVAFSDEWTVLGYDAFLLGIDANCKACESVTAAGFGGHVAHSEMASQLSGDPGAEGDALLTWGNSSLAPPFAGEVQTRRLSALGPGGPVVDLGGGCGTGGTLAALAPAAAGSQDFRFELSGADPVASVALQSLFFGSFPPFTCGSCVIEINPTQVTFVVPLTAGAASLPLALPCDASLVGARFKTQTAVFPTPTSPCSILANLSFSNRLDVTIGN